MTEDVRDRLEAQVELRQKVLGAIVSFQDSLTGVEVAGVLGLLLHEIYQQGSENLSE